MQTGRYELVAGYIETIQRRAIITDSTTPGESEMTHLIAT